MLDVDFLIQEAWTLISKSAALGFVLALAFDVAGSVFRAFFNFDPEV